MAFMLVLSLGAVLVPASPMKAATTIYVPDDYPTIQAAVNNAAAGDTIIVRTGTYNEAVTVNKDNLTIRGVDRDTVIVDGTGLGNANGFTITKSGVTVESFTTRNFNGGGIFDGHGIYVGGNENIIINNHVRDNEDGIVVDGNNNTISGNVVTRNRSYGIHFYHSSNTIKGNVVTSNGHDDTDHGICFAGGKNSLIRDNIVSGNAGAGIEFC